MSDLRLLGDIFLIAAFLQLILPLPLWSVLAVLGIVLVTSGWWGS